jgi:hypothetical protein
MAASIQSRSAQYSAFGKCDTEVKTHLPSDVAELAQKKARLLGVPISEYVRDLLIVNLYGIEHVRKLQEDRLKVLASNGPESSPDSDK